MADLAEDVSSVSSLKKVLSGFGPVFGLLLVYGLFVVIGPDSFSSLRNLETITRQTSIIGTAALGMTMIIILGGIDLSIGSVVANALVVHEPKLCRLHTKKNIFLYR